MQAVADQVETRQVAIDDMTAEQLREELTAARVLAEEQEIEIHDLEGEIDDLKSDIAAHDRGEISESAFDEYNVRPLIERVYNDFRGKECPESVRELVWKTLGWAL